MIPWILLPAHARRNLLRTLLTVGSVAVALFLFCALRTVVTTIELSLKQANSSRLIVQSALSLFAHLPIAMKQKLDPLPGVKAITHWSWFGGSFGDGGQETFFARFAVDAPTMRLAYGDKGPEDIYLPPGQWDAFESEKTACIVGRGLLERFKDAEGKPILALGNTVPMRGNIFPGEYRFTVRGVYEARNPAFDENTMFFHWNYLDEVSGRRGNVGLFVLLLEHPDRAPEVAHTVDEMFRSSDTRTLTLTERAFNLQFAGMWGNIPLFLSFIGGAVLFAAFMVTLNTLLLNARERIAEVGVLKTLGFSDASIGFLNLAEALVLCGIGGVLGTGFAWWAFGHTAWGKAMDTFMPGFRVLPSTMAEAMAIAAVLGLVSGLVPGLMAARIPLVKALRRIG